MAESPLQNSDGVVTFTIKANGQAISDEIGVMSINVFYRLNHIACAELVLTDGDVATQAFPVSEADTFKPGASIEIQVGYGNDDETIFKGIITGHAIHLASHQQSTLNVTCRDAAVAMTIARQSKSYLQQSDSDIIGSLIGNYSDVSVDTIEKTSSQHDELVQFNCSDWDFLLTRAEANGLVVCNQSNSIGVTQPETRSNGPLKLTYGTDIIAFSAEIDPRYQFSQVTGVSWDLSQQKMEQGQSGSSDISDQGNLNSSTLAKVLGLKDYRLQTSSTLTQDMLSDWAKGQQVKSALSKVRGSLSFQGSAKAKPNTLITLVGVGDRFSGSQYVSGVHHSIENGHWITTVDLGLSPKWSSEHRDLGAPAAAGWVPPVDGLQIGVVTQLDKDPQTQYRIQVQIPALGDSDNTVWTRFASYYATNTSGNFFIPEIGDEVIVGFINNDPSCPVVIGSLYSTKHKSPYEITAENNIKALVTRSQLKVEFNEENKVITVITPANNSIVLNDTDKSITLTDQKSNTVTLNESGISLDSPKDIKITAKGQISISADQKIAMTAKSDLTGEGLNVSFSAKTGFTAKGSSTAEVSASGITTIKGAMVKIN